MPPRPVIAVFPGTFDPITLGHIDVAERGAEIFDHVIVAILRNLDKEPLFTLEERCGMIREVFRGHENISVEAFEGLLVDFVRSRGARVILRGLRVVSDFEYEFQMALMNRRLGPEIETVYLTPREEFTYLSSRLVREVAALGGSVDGLVPAAVARRVRARLTPPAAPRALRAGKKRTR